MVFKTLEFFKEKVQHLQSLQKEHSLCRNKNSQKVVINLFISLERPWTDLVEISNSAVFNQCIWGDMKKDGKLVVWFAPFGKFHWENLAIFEQV